MEVALEAESGDHQSQWNSSFYNHAFLCHIWCQLVHVLLDKRSCWSWRKTIKIHPLRTMNVCGNFHDNPSNSCSYHSVCTTNVNMLVALEEKSWENPTKASRTHPLGNVMSKPIKLQSIFSKMTY